MLIVWAITSLSFSKDQDLFGYPYEGPSVYASASSRTNMGQSIEMEPTGGSGRDQNASSMVHHRQAR